MEKQRAKLDPSEIEGYIDVQTKFEAYTGNEPYLFVSYSHRDVGKVYPVLDALHDCKYRIWYDESCETGNDFRKELSDKIKGCDGVLLFVSEASMSSPFCGMEVIVATENKKRIFPVYLDNAPVPPAFHFLLANTHHVTLENREKFIKSMIRDLPAETMDRLTFEDGVLKRCEDNGKIIEIDEGISEIGAEAFKGRRALNYIKLPESLIEIGYESFRGCTNLREMLIPEKTEKIGESAFRDCTNLKRLKIMKDCIKIGERAFENCAALEDVQLPIGLAEIYGGVFNSCKSLKRIQLPNRLTILGENAFSDCVELEELYIPATVTKIDDLAFNGCVKMTRIEMNEGLKKIGKSAFKNCRALTQISLPASVTNISSAPFRGCESLKSIKVASKNKYFKSEPNKRDGSDHVLFNKNKSVLIAYPASSREVQYDVPDSVTVICDWAFSECKKLNRITIPDSVHEIGEGAFSNCVLLDEVEIPDSVTTIDDCAFRGCTNLEKVIIPSSVTEFGWGLFDDCKKVTVYCDEGSAIQEYCQRVKVKEARISKEDDEK